ncbi:hypothetical protein Leryth_015581 [Lithospermum erythrorhizon]|nr:hypothetical protein Leryth_015581 [Lithospermum erythrorhizon]
MVPDPLNQEPPSDPMVTRLLQSIYPHKDTATFKRGKIWVRTCKPGIVQRTVEVPHNGREGEVVEPTCPLTKNLEHTRHQTSATNTHRLSVSTGPMWYFMSTNSDDPSNRFDPSKIWFAHGRHAFAEVVNKMKMMMTMGSFEGMFG